MSEEKKTLSDLNSSEDSGLFAEFMGFLKENKKFWLLPIILILLLLGLVIILGGTSAAPFIYTLF